MDDCFTVLCISFCVCGKVDERRYCGKHCEVCMHTLHSCVGCPAVSVAFISFTTQSSNLVDFPDLPFYDDSTFVLSLHCLDFSVSPALLVNQALFWLSVANPSLVLLLSFWMRVTAQTFWSVNGTSEPTVTLPIHAFLLHF
jgi:hypothetical protein